jgi:hypothetical protein
MHATVEEVRLAIDQLGRADRVRLLCVASIAMQGSPYGEPRELVVDAIVATLHAAAGDGARRWRFEVPFVTHLITTMRGIAIDARRSMRRQAGDAALDGSPPHGSGSADPAERSYPSVEDHLIDRIGREHQEAIAEIVTRFFKGDAQVRWIIRGIMEKLPARRVQEMAGMTTVEYESARRRFHRGVDTLFPHRSPL